MIKSPVPLTALIVGSVLQDLRTSVLVRAFHSLGVNAMPQHPVEAASLYLGHTECWCTTQVDRHQPVFGRILRTGMARRLTRPGPDGGRRYATTDKGTPQCFRPRVIQLALIAVFVEIG